MYCWYVVTRLIGSFSPTAPQHHLNSYCVFCRLVNLYSTAIPGSRFETEIFLDLIVVASSIFYVHVFYGTVDDCRCSISLLGVLFSDGCLKDQIAPDIPSSPNYWEVMGLFFGGPAIPPRKDMTGWLVWFWGLGRIPSDTGHLEVLEDVPFGFHHSTIQPPTNCGILWYLSEEDTC